MGLCFDGLVGFRLLVYRLESSSLGLYFGVFRCFEYSGLIILVNVWFLLCLLTCLCSHCREGSALSALGIQQQLWLMDFSQPLSRHMTVQMGTFNNIIFLPFFCLMLIQFIWGVSQQFGPVVIVLRFKALRVCAQESLLRWVSTIVW